MDSAEIGHFTLLEKIGEGGMGRVYRAKDTRLARLVAIKMLPEAKLANTDRRTRFIQEARAASALNHPNIITIYEIGEQDGQTFIVMELVDGKPLNELIPRRGMRLTEALRIAVQVADALTAAHAGSIVHRDLKPANIMVDTHGRVKVLDFGLAKLTAPVVAASAADEATRTMSAEQPRTEEGVLLGSVPYMSPEQAEGKPVDARSDIFSFGAVLYEMVTGKRAFLGESRASTLAAVVEKDPQPPSEITDSTPQELERLIARCLRKDVSRRSQHMADVKLALEELRDESESGKLARSTTAGAATQSAHSWLWPVVALACLAAAAAGWRYLSSSGGTPGRSPDLTQMSPEDGYSYESPSISADSKFVAYVSDRSGSRQIWLQQIAGGEPMQLTHSSEPVLGTDFMPNGSGLIYETSSADGKSSKIEIIPTLGGQSRLVATAHELLNASVSPDGRQLAYLESSSGQPAARLLVRSLAGGEPRELATWAEIQPSWGYLPSMTWTSDSRFLISVGTKRRHAVDLAEWEWFALPVDGGSAQTTGAGDVLSAAGMRLAAPQLVWGDRVLFAGGKSKQDNVWEIRLTPGSWRVRDGLRQLTFGTEIHQPVSVSASGVVALNLFKASADFYMTPLSPSSGQPTGVTRRLTHDGRFKIPVPIGGEPGHVYFAATTHYVSNTDAYALDLTTGQQTFVAAGLSPVTPSVISSDGRQVAYSAPEDGAYSIRIGDAGSSPTAARALCKSCGTALSFSADDRFILQSPETMVKPDPNRKYTVGLLEVATGKARPWLEHPTDSISGIGIFGEDSSWVIFRLRPAGAKSGGRWFIAPWTEQPIPQAEWIELKIRGDSWNYANRGGFFQYLEGTKLMVMRFDPKTRTVGDPTEVKYVPGTAETLKRDDYWLIRGPGLVFSRREITGSVWLMKLPQ